MGMAQAAAPPAVAAGRIGPTPSRAAGGDGAPRAGPAGPSAVGAEVVAVAERAGLAAGRAAAGGRADGRAVRVAADGESVTGPVGPAC